MASTMRPVARSTSRWACAAACVLLGCSEPEAGSELSAPSRHPLRVQQVGSGHGIIRSAPDGIVCAPDCEADFDEGITVELTAEPVPGHAFIGWAGECAGASPVCRLEVHGPRVATAQFYGPAGSDAGVFGDAAVPRDAEAALDAGVSDASDGGPPD